MSMNTYYSQFKTRLPYKKTRFDGFADVLTRAFGSAWFLFSNLLFFVLWIIYNLGYFGFSPIDPYPFTFLTTFVSLEAIMLSVIVLMNQNRMGRLADIRQKLDFEIDVRSEEEITKILLILEHIQKELNIKRREDPELERMIAPTDLNLLRKIAENTEN